MIERGDFPGLDTLLWDDARKTVDNAYALKLYERRWRYIKNMDLPDKELELIKTLIGKEGDGYFLPT